MKKKVTLTMNLPAWAYLPLKRAQRLLSRTGPHEKDGKALNLSGDRDIENSWIVSHMPPGPGAALDFGCGKNPLGLSAAMCGFDVTAVDLLVPPWSFSHPRLSFVRGDLLCLDLPVNHFDLVINCSVVEHVGLTDRYDITDGKPEGDLESMARLRELMKPGGTMLLTIPVGIDEVVLPLHRVYGPVRLPRLIEGFEIENESFWVKNEINHWVECARRVALAFKAEGGPASSKPPVYALGCFVLKVPGKTG